MNKNAETTFMTPEARVHCDLVAILLKEFQV